MEYGKDNISNYPLLDYPCEYWWVRYATSCTYLQHAKDKIWEKKLDELQAKYHFNSFCYVGDWTSFEGQRLWVFHDQKRIEVTNTSSELWRVIEDYLHDTAPWIKCPYQNEHQNSCPFYKKSEFYADKSLEELRKK